MKTFIHNKLFIIYLFLGSGVFANNVSITNSRVIASDTTNLQTTIEFDISWENSWRTSAAPGNHDAAWVFVKYRATGGNWQHAWLNNTGHIAPSGSTIDIGLVDQSASFHATTNPGVGAFIYRSADGAGTFSLTDVQLKWNYGANGLTNLSIVDVQIYAIEMAYVPQASFYLGSGGTEPASFTDGSWRGTNGTTPSIPFQVTSENAIVIDSAAGNLWCTSAATYLYPWTTVPLTLPAAFPKGYKAFYCMKHAISQQGYVNFLNTLTRAQQSVRVGAVISDTTTYVQRRYVMRNSTQTLHRQGIRCDGTIAPYVPITFYCDYEAGGSLQWEGPPINQNVWKGNGIGGEASDGMATECNWTSWYDVLAYLDWSGLRPMTELEYEKACRGDQVPVPNECAWGGPPGDLVTGYVNDGQVDATALPATANQTYSGGATIGPHRVGGFATATSTRTQAGATYYGIMDMSGNTWHPCVSAAKSAGRAFTGDHGDGLLNAAGQNNVPSWPGTSATGNTDNTTRGYIYRGGTYWRDSSFLTVSRRDNRDAGGSYASRWDSQGGRGVRTAP